MKSPFSISDLKAQSMATAVLEREIAAFESNKAELVAASQGKFVLIHSDQVIGIWDTYSDALHAGYERFGIDEPFMVRQVKDVETVNLVYRGSFA